MAGGAGGGGGAISPSFVEGTGAFDPDCEAAAAAAAGVCCWSIVRSSLGTSVAMCTAVSLTTSAGGATGIAGAVFFFSIGTTGELDAAQFLLLWMPQRTRGLNETQGTVVVEACRNAE